MSGGDACGCEGVFATEEAGALDGAEGGVVGEFLGEGGVEDGVCVD